MVGLSSVFLEGNRTSLSAELRSALLADAPSMLARLLTTCSLLLPQVSFGLLLSPFLGCPGSTLFSVGEMSVLLSYGHLKLWSVQVDKTQYVGYSHWPSG